MLFLSLFIFPFPFVLLCSIQLIVTKPTSSLVAHPCCLLSRSYFSLFLLFFFYSHSTRCSFPLHIVTWIHIIGLSVGELSSRFVTTVEELQYFFFGLSPHLQEKILPLKPTTFEEAVLKAEDFERAL